MDPGLDFQGHSVSADTDLDDLRKFSVVVEQFLDSMEARTQVESDQDDWEGQYLYGESFPAILYSSTIISAVIFVERETRSFCGALRKATGARLAIRDLSGSWMDRFFSYCDKVAGLELRLNNVLRQDIRDVLEVRNCLVHAAGYLPDFQRRENVVAFLSRHDIDQQSGDFLDADKELTQAVLRIVEQFVSEIYISALKKYPYRV